MSQEQFGMPTRRAFLGTATVATAAASLTAPVVGEAHGPAQAIPSKRPNWRKLMRTSPNS